MQLVTPLSLELAIMIKDSLLGQRNPFPEQQSEVISYASSSGQAPHKMFVFILASKPHHSLLKQAGCLDFTNEDTPT